MNWLSCAAFAICMLGIGLPFALSDTGLRPFQGLLLGLALATIINTIKPMTWLAFAIACVSAIIGCTAESPLPAIFFLPISVLSSVEVLRRQFGRWTV